MSQNQLSFFCEDGHDFEMAGDGYYKNDSEGHRIVDVVYRMIFCNRCGANIEIIVADRREAKEKKNARRNRKSNANNNLRRAKK